MLITIGLKGLIHKTGVLTLLLSNRGTDLYLNAITIK